MPGRSGMWSQVGFGEETTVGTRVAATRFLEFNSESLAQQIARIESGTLRSTNRVLRTDRTVAGRKGIAGNVDLEVQSKGFGMLFKHLVGAAPTITTPTGGTITRNQAFTLGDPFGLGLSVQVGRPDVATGTVRPFDYAGCKVATWSLSNAVDGMLKLQLGLDGWTEDTAQTLVAASYPTATEILNWTGGLLNIGGAEVDVRDVTINGTVGLKTDRYLISQKTVKKEQIAAAFYEITGTITAEFESLTAYNRFVNLTLAQIDVTWKGATLIEGTLYPQLKVTMANCRFDGTTPNVQGPDILVQTLPFKAMWDGTAQPIQFDYQTTDTAV